MIEIDEEKEITIIEKDIQYLYAKIKPTNVSFRGSTLDTIKTEIIDTSNIKDMSYMFAEMKNIENLDLSDFDTSNSTNMSAMFYGSNFKSLDLSSFDTSNVTTMNGLCQGCRSLENLDLSNFDTSNVTNMSYMFTFCTKIKKLDLTSFDTSKVTNMQNMFTEMSNLEKLLGILNLENVTNVNNILSYCQKLTEIRLKNLKTNLLLNTALNLSEESINYLLLNVQDITETKTITLGSNILKASEEAIATATSRGWIVQ